MRQRCVLWVSTSTETHGGVSSFVRTMQQTPLWGVWGIRHIATHRNGSVPIRAIAFGAGAGRFVLELAVRRPQVVHLHMASYGSFVRKSLLGWAAQAAGVPVVVHVHGAEFHWFFERSPRLLRMYIRATLEHGSVVIALGESWARRLKIIAPRARIVVVPNAVRPRPPVKQPADGQPVQVLFLGDVSDRKGAFSLIDAWQRLLESPPEGAAPRLVMAGDGAVARARSRIEEVGLREHVRVLGWIPPNQVESLVRASQVLVLPSRNEGQPMAVLEAMANGLCVIVSEVGGLPDMVDTDCGVLVPVDDVPALASALHRVIVDHEERVRLGLRALRRVRDRFDVDVTWHALDELYEELQR
jgi:glycosyltransferase involved in cell wall biosynthesis